MQRFFFLFKPQIITIYTISINVKKEVPIESITSSEKGKNNSIYGKDEEIRESFIRQITLEMDLEDGHFS